MAMRTEHRRGLPPLPPKMNKRPLDHRGYPVPWFVAYVNGVWDFRVIDTPKLNIAVQQNLCWLCGRRLNKWHTFVIGPMCAISRTTAEPPCHYECAKYAAMACPFLTLPESRRNDAGLPDGTQEPAGVFIKGNPGICCLYSTQQRYRWWYPDASVPKYLIRMPRAERIEFYCHGRPATTEERTRAVDKALEMLQAAAAIDGSFDSLQEAITDFHLLMAAQR